MVLASGESRHRAHVAYVSQLYGLRLNGVKTSFGLTNLHFNDDQSPIYLCASFNWSVSTSIVPSESSHRKKSLVNYLDDFEILAVKALGF
jgi:hypothetical protein